MSVLTFDDAIALLNSIKAYTSRFIAKSNDAIIIGNSQWRSLGVNRILINYFIPNDEELQTLSTAEDKDKQLNLMAWKKPLDKTVFSEFCHLIGERQFSGPHGYIVELDSLFGDNHIISLNCNELPVGDASILALSNPTADPKDQTNWIHPTGAIDMTKYNRRTGKIVCIELKTGNSYFPCGLQSRYLKEKHVKQLHFYAFMLLNIANNAGIKLSANQIELAFAAADTRMQRVALWSVAYKPKFFLGSALGSTRWHSLIEGRIFRIPLAQIKCRMCSKPANCQSKKEPQKFYCSEQCRKREMGINS